MSTAIEHSIAVKPYLRATGSITYRPRCSCGWVGHHYGNRSNASDAAALHATTSRLTEPDADEYDTGSEHAAALTPASHLLRKGIHPDER